MAAAIVDAGKDITLASAKPAQMRGSTLPDENDMF
jgi:hypothetical protein